MFVVERSEKILWFSEEMLRGLKRSSGNYSSCDQMLRIDVFWGSEDSGIPEITVEVL